MQLSKEEYARKGLAMLNSYRRDRIFQPQLTAIKNSYNKVNV